MAVAAADFYTYARATGTPLPKTKQEEAKLTPAVNQWKNNQLRRENQGQEGINPGAVAGLTGLAGVGALALAATRGGLRQRVTEAVKPSPGSSVSTGIGGLQQDLGKVTKGRGDTWGEYKESIAPKTKVDERDFVNEAIAKVEADAIAQSKIGEYTPQELTALENRQKFIKTKGEQVRKELVAEGLEEAKGSEALSSNDFLQQQGPNKYIDPEDVTLSPGGNVPKSETVNDQTLNAIDAAEDQQTGRVNQQLQRNEDLDQSQIALMEEIAEDQDRRFGQGLESGEIAPGREYQAPIDEVAQSLPDGAPVVQAEQKVGLAETSAARFLQNERDEIASQLAEQNLPVTSGRIELELENRLGTEAYKYGPKYTQRKHALQLGATYDPRFFDNLNVSSVQVAGQTVPTIPSLQGVVKKTDLTGKTYLDTESRTALKQPTYMQETAEKLDAKVKEKKDWLGNIRLEATSNMRGLEQQANTIKAQQDLARSQGNIGAVNMLEVELNKLRGSYQKQQRRITGATKAIDKNIAGLSVPLRNTPGIEEGQRVYAQLDNQGQPIPGTQELRSERIMVDREPKGGGGRKQAESLSPSPDNPLDTLISQQQRGTGEGLLDSRRISSLKTRPLYDRLESDVLTETGGLELSPTIYDDAEGRVIDKYGVRLASTTPDSETVRPTQLVGKVKGPQTQKPTAAMRGKSGTRVVNISENIRHLSDPNWLASQGYNLNKVSPQQLVGEYLQGLQAKTGSADLQEFLQTRGQSRPMSVDAGPVVTGPDGITRGEGLRMTPLQVLKLKRQRN
jgi:hypothetical protein